MRNRIIWPTVIAAIGIACFLAWVVHRRMADPASAPGLSQPPALVGAEGMAGREPLFDGETTADWEIHGPHRVRDGTLELGGEEAVEAILLRPIELGECVEFDYFQEGTARTEMWIRPTLLRPQTPDPEFCKDFAFDLNLAGFACQRWHAVSLTSRQDGTNVKVTVDRRPYHDDRGKAGQTLRSMPARGGCRLQLVFRIEPGAKLYLRNVLLGR